MINPNKGLKENHYLHIKAYHIAGVQHLLVHSVGHLVHPVVRLSVCPLHLAVHQCRELPLHPARPDTKVNLEDSKVFIALRLKGPLQMLSIDKLGINKGPLS